jgi:hypothetical protein
VKNIVIVQTSIAWECIPSINNNIWCYPTSRVLSTFLCSLLVNGLVYSWLFLKYICRSIEVFNTFGHDQIQSVNPTAAIFYLALDIQSTTLMWFNFTFPKSYDS